MQNLSERDIAYDLLDGCKASATTYMQAVLESAAPRCRDTFHRLHDDALRSQWRMWQFLHARKEYRTDAADRQEVESLRHRMEHLWHTHQEAERGPVDGRYEGWETPASSHWEETRQPSGWQQESGGFGYAAAGSALAGAGYANPGAAYRGGGGSMPYGGGVSFEAGRNLPDGTRFEAEHNFATGAGEVERGGNGNAGGGTRYGGTGLRHDAPGANWNDRSSPVGIGAQPSDGSRRSFGENTWSAESTRKSQPVSPRY